MTVPQNSAGAHGAFRPSTALVMIAATCGWHVYLQQTSGTAHSALRPRILTKMCLPYKSIPTSATAGEVLGHALSYVALADENPPPWPHGR